MQPTRHPANPFAGCPAIQHNSCRLVVAEHAVQSLGRSTTP
jgi:hypothetical protein